MPFLVDGDNLLGTWGRPRTAAERRRLAFDLARFGARVGRRVVVVFDGPEPAPGQLGPDVLFPGPGHSADDLILELLRREPDPRGFTVVTSDRSLGDRSRWLKARVERSDRFRRRLAPADSPDKPDRESDVGYWLERFGGAGENEGER